MSVAALSIPYEVLVEEEPLTVIPSVGTDGARWIAVFSAITFSWCVGKTGESAALFPKKPMLQRWRVHVRVHERTGAAWTDVWRSARVERSTGTDKLHSLWITLKSDHPSTLPLTG